MESPLESHIGVGPNAATRNDGFAKGGAPDIRPGAIVGAARLPTHRPKASPCAIGVNT